MFLPVHCELIIVMTIAVLKRHLVTYLGALLHFLQAPAMNCQWIIVIANIKPRTSVCYTNAMWPFTSGVEASETRDRSSDRGVHSRLRSERWSSQQNCSLEGESRQRSATFQCRNKGRDTDCQARNQEGHKRAIALQNFQKQCACANTVSLLVFRYSNKLRLVSLLPKVSARCVPARCAELFATFGILGR